jgi:hypothetical protein
MNFDTALDSFCRGPKDARSQGQAFIQEAACAGRLTADEVAKLLAAAVSPMAPSEYEWSDPGSTLIYFVRDASLKNPSAAPPTRVVLKAFTKAPPKTRPALLQLLTSRADVESARAYVAALTGAATDGQYPFSAADKFANISTFAAESFHPLMPAASPEVAAVLFPALLDVAHFPQLQHPLYMMLLGFLEQDLFPLDALRGKESVFISHLDSIINAALATQQENRPGHFNWKYEPPYAEHRDLAALLIDLAGRWDAPATREVLARSPRFTDPRLSMFNAVSRLRLNIPVADAEFAAIARSPRELYTLRILLEKAEMTDRLPAACRDQAKIAEGNMVDWLCFGTELAREPDEIELVQAETVRKGGFFRRGVPIDYYFFRFRVTEEHWSKEKGWMVGMAGGYTRTPGGTTLHDGGTFSRFEAWESKSIKEHVKTYLS